MNKKSYGSPTSNRSGTTQVTLPSVSEGPLVNQPSHGATSLNINIHVSPSNHSPTHVYSKRDPPLSYRADPELTRHNHFSYAFSRINPANRDTQPPNHQQRSHFEQPPVTREDRNDIIMDDVHIRSYDTFSDRPQGEAMVLILANSTEELKGYEKDIHDITELFSYNLEYDVYGGSDTSENEKQYYRNLSRKTMLSSLRRLQRVLCDTYKRYDKLFVFVLGHGNENGVQTCENGAASSGFVSINEIIEFFTHEKVQLLQDLPKCFFIQTCRGERDLKAAGPPTPRDDADQTQMNKKVTIGTDILLCHSTLDSYHSYVHDQNGSWFIQTIIPAMRRFMSKVTLVEILHYANRIISQKSSTYTKGATCREARQCIEIKSTLTKMFYLSKPNT